MRFRSRPAGTIACSSLAALCLSTTPAAAYTSGEYVLAVESIQIFDITHTVDPHQYCAEIFGKITVSRGAETITFFQADEKHYTEVCEPNGAINEGTLSGLLRPSASTAKQVTAKFTGDKDKDLPFVFKIDLWDADFANDHDHLVHDQTVKVWPADPGVRPSSVFFQDGKRLTAVPADGHQQVRVNYDIDPAGDCQALRDERARLEKNTSALEAKVEKLEAKSSLTDFEKATLTSAERVLNKLEQQLADNERVTDAQHCASATAD